MRISTSLGAVVSLQLEVVRKVWSLTGVGRVRRNRARRWGWGGDLKLWGRGREWAVGELGPGGQTDQSQDTTRLPAPILPIATQGRT